MSLDGHDQVSLESSTALHTPPTPSLGAIKEPIYDAAELDDDNGEGDGRGDRSYPEGGRSGAKGDGSAFQGVALGAPLSLGGRDQAGGATTGSRRSPPVGERRVQGSPRAELRGLAPLPYVPGGRNGVDQGRSPMMSSTHQPLAPHAAMPSRAQAYSGYIAGSPPPSMPPTDPLPVPTPYQPIADTAPLVPRPAPSAASHSHGGASGDAGPSNTSESSPMETGSSQPPRIPSRKLLQSALDLAQRAVELDKANEVPGALAMYRDAVARLRSVMERVGMDLGPVPHGLGLPEQTEQDREEIAQARRRRKAANGRSEEEGKTLKGIHDAYIARIALLANMDPSPRDRQTFPKDTNAGIQSPGRMSGSSGRIPLPSSAVVNGVAIAHPSADLLQGPPIVRQRHTSLSSSSGPLAGPSAATMGSDGAPYHRHRRQDSSNSIAQMSTRSGASGSSGTGTQVDDRDRAQFNTLPRSASRGTRLGQSIMAGSAAGHRAPSESGDEYRPQISPRNASLLFGTQQALHPLEAEAAAQASPSDADVYSVQRRKPPSTSDLVIPAEAVSSEGHYAGLSPLQPASAVSTRQAGFNGVSPMSGTAARIPAELPAVPTTDADAGPPAMGGEAAAQQIPAIVQSQPSPNSPFQHPPPVPGKPSQLVSPQPDAPPSSPTRIPIYLLRLIHNAIISPSGGFITPRLHLPHALWTQNSAKLPFLDIKIRMLEFLAQQIATVGRMGEAVAVRSAGPEAGLRDAAVTYTRGLEELNGLMEEIMDKFGKKLGVVNPAMKSGRKSSGTFTAFGSRLSKSLDRMTNGKSPETSTAYFEALARFAGETQALDRCYSPGFMDNLDSDLRTAIEARMQMISAFLTSCILAFVLPDINTLLSRYLKLSSRYLED